jgi:uncharacterized protein YoxC
MVEEINKSFPISDDENVREQQFRRAVSSFEGIILSQIEMKNKLAVRLNYSIVAGIVILGMIAISILILLLTLTSQVNRINAVVTDMNHNFTQVADQMTAMKSYVGSMEKRVAQLNEIRDYTSIMESEMEFVSNDMDDMLNRISGIGENVHGVRTKVDNISNTVDRMDFEVVRMRHDMKDMARPSRTLNKMFPFLD